MSVQIIERDGKAEYAVVLIDEYKLLLEKAEELDDVTAFDEAMHELAVNRDELVPAETARRLVSGKESLLKLCANFAAWPSSSWPNGLVFLRGRLR